MKQALIFQGGWDGHEPQLTSRRFAGLLEEAGFEGRFHLRGIADPYIKHAPMFRSLETLGLNAESMETLVRATLAQEKGGPHEETA